MPYCENATAGFYFQMWTMIPTNMVLLGISLRLVYLSRSHDKKDKASQLHFHYRLNCAATFFFTVGYASVSHISLRIHLLFALLVICTHTHTNRFVVGDPFLILYNPRRALIPFHSSFRECFGLPNKQFLAWLDPGPFHFPHHLSDSLAYIAIAHMLANFVLFARASFLAKYKMFNVAVPSHYHHYFSLAMVLIFAFALAGALIELLLVQQWGRSLFAIAALVFCLSTMGIWASVAYHIYRTVKAHSAKFMSPASITTSLPQPRPPPPPPSPPLPTSSAVSAYPDPVAHSHPHPHLPCSSDGLPSHPASSACPRPPPPPPPHPLPPSSSSAVVAEKPLDISRLTQSPLHQYHPHTIASVNQAQRDRSVVGDVVSFQSAVQHHEAEVEMSRAQLKAKEGKILDGQPDGHGLSHSYVVHVQSDEGHETKEQLSTGMTNVSVGSPPHLSHPSPSHPPFSPLASPSQPAIKTSHKLNHTVTIQKPEEAKLPSGPAVTLQTIRRFLLISAFGIFCLVLCSAFAIVLALMYMTTDPMPYLDCPDFPFINDNWILMLFVDALTTGFMQYTRTYEKQYRLKKNSTHLRPSRITKLSQSSRSFRPLPPPSAAAGSVYIKGQSKSHSSKFTIKKAW